MRSAGAGTVFGRPVRPHPVGDGLGPRLAQRVGLRLAAAFGHRLGEVGEQHGEPEPERDLQLEAERRGRRSTTSRTSRSVVSTLPTSTTNMTGFLTIVRGWSLRSASTIARRTICGSQMRSWLVRACAIRTPVPAFIRKCSTIGPRLSAGKNVSAPTMTITLTSSAVNSGVVTGNVPSDGGTCFLRPRLPAIASGGMIMKNRPNSIVSAERRVVPVACSTLRPPNAEPLLPAPDE